MILHKKRSFLLRIYSEKYDQIHRKGKETVDLVTFIEKIRDGELRFLCKSWFGSSRIFYKKLSHCVTKTSELMNLKQLTNNSCFIEVKGREA